MRQTDYVILGLLFEAPMTGYDIKGIIDHRFRFFWSESYGQLYPALRSLNAQGLIDEIADETLSNRSKKLYQITTRGIDALKAWLHLPVEKETIRLEILLKMYFSDLVSPEIMLSHLKRFEQAHQQDLMVLNFYEKELKAVLHDHPNHEHVLRVIDFGQKANEAYLRWSKETRIFFEERTKNETEN